MKPKVYFILSSFRGGGAEKVFRLLAQAFDKNLFEATIVLLSTSDSFFSTKLEGVRVVDLGTVKASKSFYKVWELLRREKPKVVFSTGGQVNLLIACVSFFLRDIKFIARPTNQDNSKFLSLKAKILSPFTKYMYGRFDKVVCQSKEIMEYMRERHHLPSGKLCIIPNPIAESEYIKENHSDQIKRLIVVARLTPQKGIQRLVDIFSTLPDYYHLTIVGDGILKDEIHRQIRTLNLSSRVFLVGMVKNIPQMLSTQDIFVLPSFIEGFPNVVIESLSVGVPVIAFKVGGISEILTDGFNGYVVDRDDINDFKCKILLSTKTMWDYAQIKLDVHSRFNLDLVTRKYESLILN